MARETVGNIPEFTNPATPEGEEGAEEVKKVPPESAEEKEKETPTEPPAEEKPAEEPSGEPEGEGDDTGKPFIKGNGTETVIQVEVDHVIVSNFKIENPWSKRKFACGIVVNIGYPFKPKNVTISDCIISNSPHTGIYINEIYSENIKIINNHISHCNNNGIHIESHGLIMTGNVITECNETGIQFRGFLSNISANRIRRCRTGIEMGGDDNIVYGNDIENCAVGIQYGASGNIITKNNFKNYSRIGFWVLGTIGERFIDGYKKSRCIDNYWDTWSGVGPKTILGNKILWIRVSHYAAIPIPIPWFDIDWKPAKEPYVIP